MRGAQNTQSGGLKYMSFMSGKFVQRVDFMSGKFVQRVDEETTGATPRELKKGPNAGKLVHELHFDTYEGQIYNIETEAGEYGQRLHIFIDVSTELEPDSKVKLSLPLSSGPAKGFLGRLPVIDFTKDVVLKGYNIENKETGRFNSYLVPYQDGKKLLSYYTKETPNGMPRMKQIKVKGQQVWDDTEQLEFLEALITKTFAVEIPVAKGPEPVAETEESDDLPF
jgi:hypothetical protein